MSEQERRGLGEFYFHDRDLFFCATCNKTNVFKRRGDTDILVCIGDQRHQQPGCGKEMKESDLKRWLGDCLKCRRVRRATFCALTKQYLCLYCWAVVENVEELRKPQ